MPARIKALLLLALALIRTLLKRLVGGGREGIDAFMENYAADGLSAVTAEQRLEMETFGRCIACGMCDRGEGERMARSGGAYVGVMQIVLAASRSMPEYRAAATSLKYVPNSVLAEKEKICPTRVPIVKIAGFIRDRASQARMSLPASAGQKRLSPDSVR